MKVYSKKMLVVVAHVLTDMEVGLAVRSALAGVSLPQAHQTGLAEEVIHKHK